MRLHKISRVALYAAILAAALLVADSPRVSANSESTFAEMIMINVNCNDASAMTTLTVGSDNDTLMHFPSSVNLNDAHLKDATTVAVISSSERSILTYTFEGISETEAETNAEAITPSIEAAVGIDFAYNLTGTIDTKVDVNYTGPGQSNMTNFANSIVSDCVNPSVGGFSNAIPSLAAKTLSALMLSANKESEGYNWTIGIVTMSPSAIPTGTGNHTINVLNLLRVSSLAPSPYSLNATEDYYESTLWIYIMSDSSISFVSCVPPLKEYPEDLSERGWLYMFPFVNYAMFFFGSDSSAVDALTFTFKGKVVPEFTPSTIIITLILTAACIIAFKKRMLRKNT